MGQCSSSATRSRNTGAIVGIVPLSRHRRVVALVLLVAAVLAQPARARATPTDVAPDLDTVPVDSIAYRAAKTQVDVTASALANAQQLLTSSAAELDQLQHTDADLTQQLATLTVAKKQATVDLAAARSALRSLAVDQYVNGNIQPSEFDDLAHVTDLLARQGMTSAVSSGQASKATRARDAFERLTGSMTDVLTRRTDVRQRTVEVEQTRQRAEGDVTRYTAALASAQVAFARARATANVIGEDFQLVALDAYRRGAAREGASDASCGIPWWALAGITRVESKHGTYGGSTLLANGDTSRRIIGIPLDGENSTQQIPDTDGGSLDGDPVYDHAVGPMQFIPSTWRQYGVDGNGDGRADPNNIYDAAAAAARYLCASGPMRTDDDLRRGFYSYNHSTSYADTVLRFAKLYAQFAIPAT